MRCCILYYCESSSCVCQMSLFGQRRKKSRQMESTNELDLPSIKEYKRKLGNDSVFCLAVYNNFLFSGGRSSIIQQWNCEGQCIRTFIGHRDGVWILFVWKDLLYSGSNDT